jgi:hypothetical protein
MKPHVADAAITACLTGMAKLIHQADRIAKRSVEAAANDRQKAVTLALDVEPLLNEADVLLTAATIIIRQSKETGKATEDR